MARRATTLGLRPARPEGWTSLSISCAVPDSLPPPALYQLLSLLAFWSGERLDVGYRGGVSVLRDRMRALRGSRPREAFLTLHFHPGEAVQVGWADFGFAIPGCPRRVSAFIMALCHSRYLYLEFTLSQAMPAFLRCMERSLRFYGGTTVADIFDNMKTVVHRPGPPPVFNRRFLAYAGARGFSVRACNPGRGNEKGRVERPVGFVRSRFWPGRRFASLLDLNAQAASWRDDFANNRVHEITGKVPSLVFQSEERPLLKPVPASPFDTDEVEPAQATKTFRVRFDRNTYSVPWRLAHQPVVIRANDELVAIYLETQRVAVHRRSWDVGQDVKDDAHVVGLLERKPRAALAGLPPELDALGKLGARYFKVLAAARPLLAKAAKDNLTVLDVVDRLCDEEKASRLRIAIGRRIRDARFPEINTVDAFDFDFCPVRKKLRARYLALHDLAFLDRGVNPLFIGVPGTGRPSSPAPSPTAPARPTAASSSSPRPRCSTTSTAPRSTVPWSGRCGPTSAPTSSPSTTSPSSRWTAPRPSSPSR
jgi:transposase